MTPDDIARKVAEALPCDFGGHDRECIRVNGGNCPAFFRPAVEALVREAYEAGQRNAPLPAHVVEALNSGDGSYRP